MSALTLELDDELAAKLRRRAVRNGRSPEEEVRRLLSVGLIGEPATAPRELTKAEVEERYRRLKEICWPPLEPFDQKKVSDELWDFID